MDKLIFYIHVLDEIALKAINKTARRLQRDMIDLRDVFLNTDHRLQNVWEEYCAQLQGEYSNYVENFQDIIDTRIHELMNNLDASENMAILCSSMLNVPSMKKWEGEIESAVRYEDVKIYPSVIFLEVQNAVKNLAYEYESKNLRRFLDNSNEEE
jgi:hypothetical protein